jgi:hypothetical protein
MLQLDLLLMLTSIDGSVAHAALHEITDFNGDGYEDLAIGVPGDESVMSFMDLRRASPRPRRINANPGLRTVPVSTTLLSPLTSSVSAWRRVILQRD